jgi:hypothetical protein
MTRSRPAMAAQRQLGNLCWLCRRNHRLKTHAAAWRLVLTEHGVLRVTTWSGITRTTRPAGLRDRIEQRALPAPPHHRRQRRNHPRSERSARHARRAAPGNPTSLAGGGFRGHSHEERAGGRWEGVFAGLIDRLVAVLRRGEVLVPS